MMLFDDTGANLGVMPNRVVHPPLMPTRREPPVECSVVVENLASRLHSDMLEHHKS